MIVYVWLGLLLVLVSALLVFAPIEGFDNNGNGYGYDKIDDEDARDSEIPTDATMEIISSKIPNAPQPPNVDMTDAVVYAPVDQAADITALKRRLCNIQRNLPGDIADTTYGLLSPMLGNILRQSGFPLTDDTYAQIYDCN